MLVITIPLGIITTTLAGTVPTWVTLTLGLVVLAITVLALIACYLAS
jgi:hypothetical protein